MRKLFVLALGLVSWAATPVALAAQPAAPSPNPTFQYIQSVAGLNAAKRFAWTVEQAAKKYKLDPLLVARVIRLESGYNASEVSPVGAVGLMQVMPFHFANRRIPRSKWMEAATNLDLGCRILSWYKERMDRLYPNLDPLALRHRALVAYNMGPRAVVSRGIYRSRYSEIIMKHYSPLVPAVPGTPKADAKKAAEVALKPKTASEVVYQTDRPESVPSMVEVNRVAEQEMPVEQAPAATPSVLFFP